MRGGAYAVFPIFITSLTVCDSRRSRLPSRQKSVIFLATPAGDGGSRPVRSSFTPGDDLERKRSRCIRASVARQFGGDRGDPFRANHDIWAHDVRGGDHPAFRKNALGPVPMVSEWVATLGFVSTILLARRANPTAIPTGAGILRQFCRDQARGCPGLYRRAVPRRFLRTSYLPSSHRLLRAPKLSPRSENDDHQAWLRRFGARLGRWRIYLQRPELPSQPVLLFRRWFWGFRQGP